MRKDAIQLEEQRLKTKEGLQSPVLHERHRVFPAVFEERKHHRILDVAAGVGYAARRIKDRYPADMICNDIAPTCLESLHQAGLTTLSYTIDSPQPVFPFASQSFDAVIALATIEHVIHVDNFVAEIQRILTPEGCFYVSAPNYAGLIYLLPVLWSGRTFHNPLNPAERYEFYAHVRYFTYRTLLEFIPTFGFVPEAVYCPIPKESSHFKHMLASSKLKAFTFRWVMSLLYRLSPRWSSEPVLCFRKTSQPSGKFRRILL
jgi:SAM-dependent methyltransferase